MYSSSYQTIEQLRISFNFAKRRRKECKKIAGARKLRRSAHASACEKGAQACASFESEECAIPLDVFAVMLKYVNVRDACALSATCRDWNWIVRTNEALWKRCARGLGGICTQVADVESYRRYCLKTTMHGFDRNNRIHAAKLHSLLRLPSFHSVTSWMLSSFLRAQVTSTTVKACYINDGSDMDFIIIAQTKDWAAYFVFFSTHNKMQWRIGIENGHLENEWHTSSENALVQQYHEWIDKHKY